MDDSLALMDSSIVPVESSVVVARTLPTIPRLDHGRMAVTVVISTQAEDRSRDIVLTKGIRLDHHRLNPVVLLEHGEHYPLPLGMAEDPDRRYTVRLDNEHALGTTFFSQSTQEAEQAYALVEEGVLRGASIGFRPLKVRKRSLPYDQIQECSGLLVEECELLEYSHCVIPDNPECVVAITSIMSKNRLAGRQLSPLIRKSLLPYLPPRKAQVVSGYSAKAAAKPAGGDVAGEGEKTSPAPGSSAPSSWLADLYRAMVLVALRGAAKAKQVGSDQVDDETLAALDGLADLAGEQSPPPELFDGPRDRAFKAWYSWWKKGWENRGKAPDGRRNIWRGTGPDKGKTRIQISMPGTGRQRRRSSGDDAPASGAETASASTAKAQEGQQAQEGQEGQIRRRGRPKAPRMSVAEGLEKIKQRLADPGQITEETIDELYQTLKGMLRNDLRTLSRELGGTVSGLKDTLAYQIAERAVRLAREGQFVKKEEEPVPTEEQTEKTEPQPESEQQQDQPEAEPDYEPMPLDPDFDFEAHGFRRDGTIDPNDYAGHLPPDQRDRVREAIAEANTMSNAELRDRIKEIKEEYKTNFSMELVAERMALENLIGFREKAGMNGPIRTGPEQAQEVATGDVAGQESEPEVPTSEEPVQEQPREGSAPSVPDPEVMKESIMDAIASFLRNSPVDVEKVPVYHLREQIRNKFGDTAASVEIFDRLVNQMRKDGILRMVPIADTSGYPKEQLDQSIQGAGETIFYLKPTDNNLRWNRGNEDQTDTSTVDTAEVNQTINDVLEDLFHSDKWSEWEMVPIYEIRRQIREKLGSGAASREVFDKLINQGRREGLFRLVPISDNKDATPDQLADSIPGVNEDIFYIKPTNKLLQQWKEQSKPVEQNPPATLQEPKPESRQAAGAGGEKQQTQEGAGGGSVSQYTSGPVNDDQKREVYQAMLGIERNVGKGAPLLLADLRNKIGRGMSKEAFDKMMIQMANNGDLVLLRHDQPSFLSPQERADIVYDPETDTHYTAAALRADADLPALFQEVASGKAPERPPAKPQQSQPTQQTPPTAEKPQKTPAASQSRGKKESAPVPPDPPAGNTEWNADAMDRQRQATKGKEWAPPETQKQLVGIGPVPSGKETIAPDEMELARRIAFRSDIPKNQQTGGMSSFAPRLGEVAYGVMKGRPVNAGQLFEAASYYPPSNTPAVREDWTYEGGVEEAMLGRKILRIAFSQMPPEEQRQVLEKPLRKLGIYDGSKKEIPDTPQNRKVIREQLNAPVVDFLQIAGYSVPGLGEGSPNPSQGAGSAAKQPASQTPPAKGKPAAKPQQTPQQIRQARVERLKEAMGDTNYRYGDGHALASFLTYPTVDQALAAARKRGFIGQTETDPNADFTGSDRDAIIYRNREKWLRAAYGEEGGKGNSAAEKPAASSSAGGTPPPASPAPTSGSQEPNPGKGVPRHAAAQTIAQTLNREGYRARAWTGTRGNAVRVYVSDDRGRDIGFIQINPDGTLEPQLSRQKGTIMGLLPELTIRAEQETRRPASRRLDEDERDQIESRRRVGESERFRELG